MCHSQATLYGHCVTAAYPHSESLSKLEAADTDVCFSQDKQKVC